MTDSVHSQLVQKIKSYQMPPAAVELLTEHKPLIIAGVSAAGKSAVAEHIQSGSDFAHVITHTTRPPRAGEANGQNYWFVTEEQLLKLLDDNAMVEANAVHGETIYGSSIAAYEAVVAKNWRPLMVIDIQGVEIITRNVPGLNAAFLLPPTFEIWLERLDKRGQMSHVERARRLQSAASEMEHVLNNSHFNLFINRDVPTVADQITRGVVIPAEQHHNRDLVHRLIESIHAY